MGEKDVLIFEESPLLTITQFRSLGPQVLALSICSENVIEIVEDQAIGYITKPHLISKNRKDRFFSAITFGLIKPERLRTGNYTDFPQEIKLDRALKFIIKRTKLS